MIPPFVIVTVLALLICAAAVSLWLGGRENRMDHQIGTALPASDAADLPSIRRSETGSRSQLAQRLANYSAEIPYLLHPVYVLLAGFVAAAAFFYVSRLFGFSTLTVSIAAAIVAILVIRGLFAWQQQRVANQLFRQLPDVVQLVTTTVRSGLPVHEAFRIIAREMPQPTAAQFAVVCNELKLGRAPEEAIEAVYQRTHVAEYAMFAVTLAVQLKAGGSLAETLQTLGETVSQRVALAARAKALAAEVIFSSRALSLMPLFMGGMLYWISPQSIDLLFRDPTGNKMLAYAACSVLVGHLVIRWMIRRETTV
jgi:tight adherence protein B